MVGRVVDPETGLIYLQARYYDPNTAQFLSRDPLDPLTRSAYGYVYGNPLNGADRTGLGCGWSDPGACVKNTVHAVSHAVNAAGTCFVELCIAHPIEAVAAVVAVATISGLVIWGGVVACATVIGCIAGAPLIIIGAAGEVAAGVLAYEEFKHRGVFYPKPERLQGALSSFNTCASTPTPSFT